MNGKADFTIKPGFWDAERPIIAELYWQAFGAKLNSVLGPTLLAHSFLIDVLDPKFGLVARDTGGRILGVAGYKTNEGALVGGGVSDMTRHYGFLGTLWRVPLLLVLEREVEEGLLLMDGICVTEAARGRGIGSALLEAIKSHATDMKLDAVRLDVIDSNPRARALYQREGFVEEGDTNMGPLQSVFGFRSAKRMVWHRPTQCRNAAN